MFTPRIILYLFVLSTLLLKAQRHEFGSSFGATNYFGDLNHEQRIEPDFGYFQILYKNNRTKYYTFGISAARASLSSSDANSNIAWQQNRNASFRSNINELSSFLELNFIPMDKSGKKNFIVPYMKFGTGVFNFNTFTNSGVPLTVLNTEGQSISGNPIASFNMFLLYGLGIKIGLGKHLSFGFDISLRKTSTDYLDDVSGLYPDEDIIRRVYGQEADLTLQYVNTSLDENIDLQGKQRGSSFKSDDYILGGFFFTYTINNPKCPMVLD